MCNVCNDCQENLWSLWCVSVRVFFNTDLIWNWIWRPRLSGLQQFVHTFRQYGGGALLWNGFHDLDCALLDVLAESISVQRPCRQNYLWCSNWISLRFACKASALVSGIIWVAKQCRTVPSNRFHAEERFKAYPLLKKMIVGINIKKMSWSTA